MHEPRRQPGPAAGSQAGSASSEPDDGRDVGTVGAMLVVTELPVAMAAVDRDDFIDPGGGGSSA